MNWNIAPWLERLERDETSLEHCNSALKETLANPTMCSKCNTALGLHKKKANWIRHGGRHRLCLCLGEAD